MLWGAVVKDSMAIDETSGDTSYVIKSARVRVGGSTYGHGLAAGRVIYDGGNVIGADDPSINHVWRVRKIGLQQIFLLMLQVLTVTVLPIW